MKKLIIIGARGYGREIFHFAKESIEYGTDFIIKVFLDENSDALDGYDGYPPILNSVEEYVIEEDDEFTCALDNVNYKRKYVNLMLSKGGEFINIIHCRSEFFFWGGGQF